MATDTRIAGADMLYSSGTTGRPKGVQLTQSNLANGVSQYPDHMGLGPDSVVLVAMPLFHIGGGGWILAGFVLAIGMAVDANVIIYERIREELRAGKSAVSAIEECPSVSMTARMGTPPTSMNDAAEWRRSCNRILGTSHVATRRWNA